MTFSFLLKIVWRVLVKEDGPGVDNCGSGLLSSNFGLCLKVLIINS